MPIPKWPALPRPKAPLPGHKDFDPWDGFLDAEYAWKNFGGLTLPQAWELFCENPIHYQEDFMFMGPVAFAYYFPVIDRHLREAQPTEVDDDCLAWIIGRGVQAQLEGKHRFRESLLQEIAELAAYVKGFVEKFRLEDGERITTVWEKVAAEVEKRRSGV
jgi:hypothetical protein